MFSLSKFNVNLYFEITQKYNSSIEQMYVCLYSYNIEIQQGTSAASRNILKKNFY